ncbi:hypothetical protein Rhe02_18380 [Rhizocola hellebori]|uniref:Uncharacterized protein n=2 Tax=Rhizocola hellebori TaxID=1392758 RepID=A0A8J3Q5N3_9ACTN|nr:hypothetical protein Rhe02_18380 [Rhizocola hellebori]
MVLDELKFLATVEHALVVEALSVRCSLGHDLDAEEGGATSDAARDAASAASNLALSAMFRLKDINRLLIKANEDATLERATSITSQTAGAIALGPPDLAQLQQLLTRGHHIATAVDRRYERLRPAVTTDPVFDGDLLFNAHTLIVDDGPTHAASFAQLRDALGALTPAEFLRATRREAADRFELRLLEVSDRGYRLVLAALRGLFVPEDSVCGALRNLAVDAMEVLDHANRVLVSRGLLPPFTIR